MLKRYQALAILLASLSALPAPALDWLTDPNAAAQQARAEGKVILLDFTGSDWCVWCKRLKSEVFDTADFATFVQANLVLVEVDFPRGTPLSPMQQTINQQLAATYKITGYPTIVLVNTDGQEIGRTGYVQGGPRKFLATIEKVPGIRPVEFPAETKKAAQPEPEAPRRPPPAFVPIAPAAAVQYGDLALKGISGSAGNRFAMINNQTLAAGESAKVKVKGGTVQVLCREILDDSVLITVDGKPVELKLGGK
jgi:thioredoxin-related protein